MNSIIVSLLYKEAQKCKSENIIHRVWIHYGQKYETFLNVKKLINLSRKIDSAYMNKIIDFIIQYIVKRNVPNKEFTNDKNRCSLIKKINCDIFERPSRYKSIIKQALKEVDDTTKRHYYVLKRLVEDENNNMVICEIPIWSKNYITVGHMDIWELCEGNPTLMIWDYKPKLHIDERGFTGQLMMYKILTCELLDLPYREVGIGAFNEVMEVLISD